MDSSSGAGVAEPLLGSTGDGENTATPLISSVAMKKDAKRFGFVVGVCFCINYIIGVGILNMPKAFYGAGVALAPVVLFCMATVVVINILWVTEASARSVALHRFVRASHMNIDEEGAEPPKYDVLVMDDEDQVESNAVEDTHKIKAALNSHTLRQRFKTEVDASPSLMNMRFDYEAPNDPLAKAEKALEVNELLDLFCPFWVKYVYEFCLLALLFLALWGYTYVFGSSVITKLPMFAWGHECKFDGDLSESVLANCEWSFRATVFIFGVCVVIVSLREYTEMVAFQLVMTVARFALIFIVVGVCIAGLFYDTKDNGSTRTETPYWGNNFTYYNFSGLGSMISTCLFSQLLDFAVPEVIEPLKKKDQISRLFVVAIYGTAFFYTIIGVSSVLYFGDMLGSTESEMNKLLANYTGGFDKAPWWAVGIQYYVLLFPALDVLSMYPLVAITLGNSLVAFVVRTYAQFGGKKTLPMKVIRILCRLLAAVPPVAVQSVFVKDLSSIINYTAFPGCFIACGMPLLLQYYSRKRCRQVGAPMTTPYLPAFLGHEIGQGLMALFCLGVYVLLILAQFGVV